MWLTDIHLDFLSPRARDDFFAAVTSRNPDAVFLTGDISVAPSLLEHLGALCDATNKPVYFVLGNHDFDHGSIADVRAKVKDFCHTHPLLHYLTDVRMVALTQSTTLVGHDGWSDSRYGDYPQSAIRLNDHVLIKELTGLIPRTLQQELMRLGTEAAIDPRHIFRQLLEQPMPAKPLQLRHLFKSPVKLRRKSHRRLQSRLTFHIHCSFAFFAFIADPVFCAALHNMLQEGTVFFHLNTA